ncbi:MAG: hypothetical protein ACRDV7_05630 [Acidimicrobiia bacterium]
MCWFTAHGRHVGNGFPQLSGVPVRGRDIAWDQAHIFRVRDGPVMERWAVRDTAPCSAGSRTDAYQSVPGASSEWGVTSESAYRVPAGSGGCHRGHVELEWCAHRLARARRRRRRRSRLRGPDRPGRGDRRRSRPHRGRARDRRPLRARHRRSEHRISALMPRLGGRVLEAERV